MNDDASLLRRYVEEDSETAFTELVHRHVDLVYAAAMRRTDGDAHRAADVAQQVFTTLAREARKLAGHPALGAWLHTATRNAALNLMISEQRRRTREQTAYSLAPATDPAASTLDWDRVRPVLDAAIDELPEADRTAVILRFLKRSSFSHIGAALRVTEDAARVRTDRALEKLRAGLARRGITSTAAALSALVEGQPVISAPIGLATTLASNSLATVGGSLGIIAQFIALMNTKLVTTAAVTALVFFGVGLYVGFDATARLPLPPLAIAPDGPQKIAALREQNLRLQAQVDQLNVKPAPASTPRPAPPTPVAAAGTLSAEAQLVRLSERKAMRNNLRQLSAVADKFQADHGRAPSSLSEVVGEGKYIRQLVPVNGESYANLSLAKGMPLTVFPADGEPVTYDPNEIPPPPTPEMARLNAMTEKLRPSISKAVESYRAAHNGQTPPRDNPTAMIPYFSTPQEGADFVELLEAQKASAEKK